MSDCTLLKKYLTDHITSVERISLLSHIKGCVLCGTTLKREGLDLSDAVIMLLADEDMGNDPVVTDQEYRTRKERNYQSLKKRVMQREQSIPQAYIKRFFSLFDKSPGLKPVFATLLLLVTISGIYTNRFDIWKQLDPSTTPDISGLTEKRAPSERYVDLILRMQKNNSMLHNNGEIILGNVALFSYSVINDAYISVIHIKDKEITIIKKEELTKDGEYKLDDLGWRFESRGDHYFIASASNRPVMPEILEVLKERGIEGLQKADISLSVKKITAK